MAAAVMASARAQLQTPERERLTLGVAAFSTPQREAIVDRLEALRRDDPSCEPFFAEGAVEPFFVKNLENVQGDERDVIFISVGYGRNAEGRIALNFGPLNAEGGERRLNVLITRARLRCEVFTNLQPEDLDLERSPARGMRALRTFLAYARDGRIESRQRAVGGEEPPTRVALVEMMAEVLRQAGHEVDVAVGISGVQVDLAVRDPDMPGRYRLGITCDGPTYHSARSARDRDRLRRQVLEKLGWRLHRVWSADWFRDPGQERVRLLAAAEARPDAPPVSGPPPTEPEPPVAAMEQPPAEPDLADSPPTEPELAAEPEPTSSLGAVPYAVAEIRVDLRGREFHEIPAPTMARWVADVVAVEGPVHLVEVSRRLLEGAGVKRSGSRIQAAIALAVEAAARLGHVERRGEFLWQPGQGEVPIRDRSALPGASRRAELVAPEEYEAAILRVVAVAFGLEPAGVASAAGHLLGFSRVSDDLRARIEETVSSLLASGRLERRGEHLVAANPPSTTSMPDPLES
ncbi:MAG: DUF3320 domain-containing protein [Isosphaeraceae bacterium]